MRLLWFSPVPLPAVCTRAATPPSYGGSWISSLLHAIASTNTVALAIAWGDRNCIEPYAFEEDGIRYYVFPDRSRLIAGNSLLRRAADQLDYAVGLTHDQVGIEDCVRVVDDYGPDIVQVFGAEHRYGLIGPAIRVPMVLWIQGILDACLAYFFGTMRFMERLRYPKLWWDYFRMKVRASREREIFRRCNFFMGRTRWDMRHQQRLQPRGRYYHVDECMRPEFYSATPWERKEDSDSVLFTTTSSSLLKGSDTLIRALGLLRKSKHPQLRLRIAGSFSANAPVFQRLCRVVEEVDLSRSVEFVGQLDSLQISEELRKASVFVLPSFIENSPNSLAEAQLVGTPVVASCTGGIPDMVADGTTGLLSPVGDWTAMAAQISRILSDREFAGRLSTAGRAAAHRRHSVSGIRNSLLEAYSSIKSCGCQS